MVWWLFVDSLCLVGVFVCVMGLLGDCNVVDFVVNVGVMLKVLFVGCDNDVVGIVIGYVKIGLYVCGFDGDIGVYMMFGYLVCCVEIVIEVIY